MHSALRLINLAAVVLAIAAIYRDDGGEHDAAYAAGKWTAVVLLCVAPTLAFLGLRRGASRGLRKASQIVCGVLLAFFLIVGAVSMFIPANGMNVLLGSAMICLLCGLDIWGLRNLSRREDHEDVGSRGFVGSYWRGELPLGETYWAGGLLVLLLQLMVMGLLGLIGTAASLRVGAGLVLAMLLIATLLMTWQSVGIWRSASRRAREGRPWWPFLAKLSVVSAVVAFGLVSVRVLWIPVREHLYIAMGKDRLEPIEARVTTDDTVLLLHGTFGAGSAQRVRRVLDASPAIATVALSSRGGRLREAADIAALVRERGLDTYVDTGCESACTFVFLAGKDRAATPNARIGFHRPSFAGLTTLSFDQATQGMLATYREAGIPQSFLDRVAATDPANMWYPSRSELEKAGVINRISLGGETSALGFLAVGSKQELAAAFNSVPMMVAMERHFPGTIDAAVQAAWMERTQGGIDSAVSIAARNVISERYPRILAAATDPSLDEFASIMVEQMKAAREISFEACKRLLAGELNIAQVLSPKLVQREHDWALHVLEAQELVDREPVDALQFDEAMARATSVLSADIIETVGQPEKFQDQPQRHCDATIALYDRIVNLPSGDRHLLLRGMFQAGAL